MSMTFSQYVMRLAQNIGPLGEGINWQVAIPEIIDYAEQRVYRDLDMLVTWTTDTSGSLTALSPTFTLPTPTAYSNFLIIDAINVLDPYIRITQTSDTRITQDGNIRVLSGSINLARSPLVPTSRQYLDFAWPSPTGAGLPQYFAMKDQNSIVVGPWPDSNYAVEVIGTVNPQPLSATNPTTFLTLYLPDLFIAASMAFLAQYRKAWVPDMSQDAEAQYMLLKNSAASWEARKRFSSASWTSKPLEPAAIPQRG